MAIIDSERTQAERLEHVFRLEGLKDYLSKKDKRKGASVRRGIGNMAGHSPEMEGNSSLMHNSTLISPDYDYSQIKEADGP